MLFLCKKAKRNQNAYKNHKIQQLYHFSVIKTRYSDLFYKTNIASLSIVHIGILVYKRNLNTVTKYKYRTLG